jgi:plastocyanin
MFSLATKVLTIRKRFDKIAPNPGRQPMAQTYKVEITEMKFPDSVPVARGDTVEWTNRMGMAHTVTADNSEFDSGALSKGQTFSHVFNDAGMVSYHCEIHDFMKGAVVVT